MADDTPVPVAAYTTFFELPFDLGLDLRHVWTYERAAPWPGWDASSMAELISVPAALPEGLRPLYRLVFRRTPTRATPPDDLVEIAFGRWIRDGQPAWRRWMARSKARVRATLGRRQYRTVVGITRWAEAGKASGIVARGLADALQALNDFLTAYGLASHDPLIGPMNLAEMPSDALLVGTLAYDKGVAAERAKLVLHPWRVELLARPRGSEDLDHAAAVLDATRRNRDPTFPIVAMLHSSVRDMLDGRLLDAAIFSATAIELLVEATLRCAWAPSGLPARKLQGALNAGFRNQLKDHLPRVLGVPIDPQDANTEVGRWLSVGYTLRNAVVHRGSRPTTHEVAEAIESAFEMAAFVGRQLQARPETAPCHGLLPTRRVTSRRYGWLADT